MKSRKLALVSSDRIIQSKPRANRAVEHIPDKDYPAVGFLIVIAIGAAFWFWFGKFLASWL